MKIVRVLLLATGLLFAASAKAAIWSDLWWNPAESGWGVTITQQGNVMFLTYFVYDATGAAKWFTATLNGGATQSNGHKRYDGDLYETRGPFYGGSFDPAKVTVRKVGTSSFVPANTYSAAFSYSVDGVAVNKQIQRQSFTHIQLGGKYFGGYTIATTTCSGVPVGGFGTIRLELAATVNADGLSGNLDTQVSFGDAASPCTLTGTYRQHGSIYSVTNTAACTSGNTGEKVNFSDLSSTDDGIDGNITVVEPSGCFLGVTFSAVRY